MCVHHSVCVFEFCLSSKILPIIAMGGLKVKGVRGGGVYVCVCVCVCVCVRWWCGWVYMKHLYLTGIQSK